MVQFLQGYVPLFVMHFIHVIFFVGEGKGWVCGARGGMLAAVYFSRETLIRGGIFIYNRVLTGASLSFNFYSLQTFCAKNMRGSRHWMEPFLWLRKWWLAALASKDMWRASLTTRQRGRS